MKVMLFTSNNITCSFNMQIIADPLTSCPNKRAATDKSVNTVTALVVVVLGLI